MELCEEEGGASKDEIAAVQERRVVHPWQGLLPETKLILNSFNSLPYWERTKFNLCDPGCHLEEADNGDYYRTFINGVRGSSRWVCRRCLHHCNHCNADIHPLNTAHDGCPGGIRDSSGNKIYVRLSK